MRGTVTAVGPADTILGLRLVGIDGTVVTTLREAEGALDHALSRPGMQLVLLSEAWSDALHDVLQEAAEHEEGPLIVEIPDPGGEGAPVPLLERVEALLGMQLSATGR